MNRTDLKFALAIIIIPTIGITIFCLAGASCGQLVQFTTNPARSDMYRIVSLNEVLSYVLTPSLLIISTTIASYLIIDKKYFKSIKP